jgi:hypothetical protein
LPDYAHERHAESLWKQYVFSKQTLRELHAECGYSKKQLARLFEAQTLPEKVHRPRPVRLVADATFFGMKETRLWGVVVFRDFHERENLWWTFVDDETTAAYYEGRAHLESLGYSFLSATCDGLPGLLSVFKDIPTQFCHFHQTQIVRRYVTEHPKLAAGHELLELSKTLTITTEAVFARRLGLFINRRRSFLNEKTTDPITGKWFFTHRRLRSAVHSFIRNLPHLFTFEKFPNLKIPTTTNALESHFSHIKDIVRIHRGLSLSMKQKVIHAILLNSSIVLKKKRTE